MWNNFSFFDKFLLSYFHHLSLVIIYLKILNYLMALIGNSYWEWINEIFLNSIFSVAINTHWCPLVISTSIPISHMFNSSISCRGSRTESSLFNYCWSSLLYLWYKSLSSPFIIKRTVNLFTFNSCISCIWEHGWWMITPYTKSLYIINMTI
jgi:hypothetical protein